MKTITAAEAKQKFGQLIDMSHKGAVAITKHGRRVAVIVSNEDFERDEALKLTHLVGRLEKGSKQIREGKTRPASSVHADIKAMFEAD